jgi:hypothetical protein
MTLPVIGKAERLARLSAAASQAASTISQNPKLA